MNDRISLAPERSGRIYIAGPMTGLPDFNFPAFNDMAAILRGLGYHVENPAEHGVVEGAEWADYLRYDIGRLATCEAKFAEAGGRVEHVYARGTSSWAFDGSGKLKRDAKHYELATFSTGKQYNCDLNASYNIAARYWAWKLKLTRRKDGQLPEDKSSPGKPRMPVTLSTLWQREQEAPQLCAA